MADGKNTTSGQASPGKGNGADHHSIKEMLAGIATPGDGDLLVRLTIEEVPAPDPPDPPDPPRDDEAEIERLAKLAPLAFEREAAASAKRLGCPISLLRKLVARARGDGGTPFGQGRPIEFPAIIPWKGHVDGADLLTRMTETIRRYVILDEDTARGVALWVVQAHAFGVAQFAPKLLITSPQKRSGKTRLMRVCSHLVPKPLPTVSITGAAVLRVVDGYQPTLLIDEVDTVLSETSKSERSEELRGIINGGFDRPQAFVSRSVPVGDGWEVRQFSIWCPQILAGIGRLAETVADRGYHVRMKRKLRNETVARLRERDAGPLWELRSQAARWASDNLEALARIDPEDCATINDRANDAWSLCFAIAEQTGGNWLSYAYRAALALSGEEPDDESNLPVMLLADIRAVFDARGGTDRISSKLLVECLLELDDRPWAEIGRARKPLTENMLARLLRTFRDANLKSSTIRFADGLGAKGYHLSVFKDAFARWLPA
jgi:putative DNA primase/helicase